MRHTLLALLLVGLLLSAASSARAGIISIQPGPVDGKDAQLEDDERANDNFGNSTLLINNTNNRTIGLVQFDLSALSALPANAVITSATLTLYHWTNFNSGTQYDVFRITSDWEELGVTFNKPPTIDPTAVATLVIPDNTVGVHRDWDVTSLVQGWVAGSFSNFGMWIEEIPASGTGTAIFTSSDDDLEFRRPKLTITYNAVPEPSSLLLISLGLAPLALGLRRAPLRRA